MWHRGKHPWSHLSSSVTTAKVLLLKTAYPITKAEPCRKRLVIMPLYCPLSWDPLPVRSSVVSFLHLLINRFGHIISTWPHSIYSTVIRGRRGGFMVSALCSESSVLGSSSVPGYVGLWFWESRHFTLTAPISTQVYKWVTGELNAQDNPEMD